MIRLISIFIFLIPFVIISAQEIDNLVQKVEPIFCNCVEKINSYKSFDDLGNQLEKCNNTYELSKNDSLLIKNIGVKKYERKIFEALRVNCCSFKKIFTEVMEQSIEKRKTTNSEIDSIKTKTLIGNNLSDNKKHFNFFSEAIKVKITDIKKDNCNYPIRIFATNNGITFRISTLFDNNIMISQDDFLLIGKIQDNADGVFVINNNLNESYFLVYTVINLRTLEMRKIK